MMVLIFDTETTGLPKNFNADMNDINNWPRLVQLSWIISDGVNSREYDFIIKPNGFEIPEEVSKIHGITNQNALENGVDLEFVLNIFRGFFNISNRVVAHNIDFDKNIIGAEYHRIGLGEAFKERLKEKDLFCTMKNALDENNRWPKLIDLHKKLFNEGFDGAHNSLNDTRACARVYFELIKNQTK